MEDLTIAVYIALTTGLVEVVKRVFPKIGRFAPIVSLTIGVLLMLTQGANAQSLIQGLLVGLSASGLYSGGKALIKL